jgi:RNA methyltransferase, TrmH family
MKRMAEMRAVRAAPPFSESIESRENRWLKRFRAALSGDSSRAGAAARPRAGTSPQALPEGPPQEEIAGVEGARLVETALHSGAEILALLFSDTGAKHMRRLQPSIPPEARLLRTTDRLFAFASGTETPQGVAALVRPRLGAFDDLIGGTPLILILAGVQDPGNVGTLVRTAEALGASGVAACAAGAIGTANPFSPKALRASAGAALRLPIARGLSAPVLLAQLRIAGVRVCAACPDESFGAGGAASGASQPSGASQQRRAGERSVASEREAANARGSANATKPLAPWEIDWRGPVALLIGNEGAGLPEELVRSADAVVRIPHAPQYTKAGGENAPAESLNAAIAGSILLYEAARQRGLNL